MIPCGEAAACVEGVAIDELVMISLVTRRNESLHKRAYTDIADEV
jgi:hypothetical protein